MVIVMEVIIVEVEEMSDDVLFLKPDDDAVGPCCSKMVA
jgi:hypothetical protein